jgi:dTDP-4-amino-4,6-dideoxygalactose transaminase
MISIEGKYSFETLAAFFSNPQNPVGVAYSSSITLTESDSEETLTLFPLNSSHSTKVFNSDPLSSITFILQNQDFEILDKFLLLKRLDESFLLTSLDDKSAISERVQNIVAETILHFLDMEFGVESLLLCSSFPKSLMGDALADLKTILDYSIIDNLDGTEINVRSGIALDKILTAGPSISVLEQSYISDAAKSGWNSQHSDYLTAFEKFFAEYVGSKYAMATSSCTGALHLSLLALGIGPGDEVIVPDITWVATASAVRYVGAKPIFVDVLSDSWTLDPVALRASITKNTRAIIPVHLYGYGARMPEIILIAQEFGLRVVEDAAPAIGTQIQGKSAGTYGDFGCYSFQGAKLLVTGEGGMVVTDDPVLYAKVKKIQDHGRRPGTFWIEELGYKYKMNNITAALGLAQIQRAPNQIDRKRRINSWYREGLDGIQGINFQTEDSGTKSICWMTSFTLGEECRVNRDGLIAALKRNDIDSRPVFPSISQYEIWGYTPKIPRTSKFIGDSGINLPSGVMLNKSTIERVIDTIRQTI